MAGCFGTHVEATVHIHANNTALLHAWATCRLHVYREEEQRLTGDASGSMILLRDYEEHVDTPVLAPFVSSHLITNKSIVTHAERSL